MLENTGQQNFEKTRRKIDLAIFFNSPPTEMWYCMLSISLMQTSIIQNYSSQVVIQLAYPYSMFCPADGCIQSLNVQNFPILLHS